VRALYLWQELHRMPEGGMQVHWPNVRPYLICCFMERECCRPAMDLQMLPVGKSVHPKMTINAKAPTPIDATGCSPRLVRSLVAVLLTIALAAHSGRVFAEQDYLLAPGDIIRISVFKNPDLSLDARVSETGGISYPLVGSVPVSGLTLSAAERKNRANVKRRWIRPQSTSQHLSYSRIQQPGICDRRGYTPGHIRSKPPAAICQACLQ